MAKVVQICASTNDLFSLDDDGVVYQYNFNTNTWMKLGRGRSTQGEASSADGQTATAPPTSRSGAPQAEP